MKNINHLIYFTQLFISLTCGSFLNSQTVIFEDDFAYSSGSILQNSGGWNSSAPFISINNIQVFKPGLRFNGYVGSNIANQSNITSTNAIGRTLFNNYSTLSNGVIYYSFMFNVDSIFNSGNNVNGYITGLADNGTDTINYTNLLYVKPSTNFTNKFWIGFNKKKGIPTQFLMNQSTSTFDFSTDRTFLIVMKYQFNFGLTTNDISSIYIFDSTLPETEPTPNVSMTTGADASNFQRVFLNSSLSGIVWAKIDGLRIGTSWSMLFPPDTTQITDSTSKVVFDFDQAIDVLDPIRFLNAISEIKKLVSIYDTSSNVVLVVHHKAVKFFDELGSSLELNVKKNYLKSFQREINALNYLGVKIYLCQDAITTYRVGNIYNFCLRTAFGTKKIMDLQDSSYSYIKPQ